MDKQVLLSKELITTYLYFSFIKFIKNYSRKKITISKNSSIFSLGKKKDFEMNWKMVLFIYEK